MNIPGFFKLVILLTQYSHKTGFSEVTSCSIEVDCAVGSCVVAVVAVAVVAVADGVRQHSGS